MEIKTNLGFVAILYTATLVPYDTFSLYKMNNVQVKAWSVYNTSKLFHREKICRNILVMWNKVGMECPPHLCMLCCTSNYLLIDRHGISFASLYSSLQHHTLCSYKKGMTYSIKCPFHQRRLCIGYKGTYKMYTHMRSIPLRTHTWPEHLALDLA